MKKKITTILFIIVIFGVLSFCGLTLYRHFTKEMTQSETDDDTSTILLNKKEIIFKEDGETFVLIVTLPSSRSEESFTFECDNNEAIDLIQDGNNRMIVKRLQLFSETVHIYIKNEHVSDQAVCKVRCYNQIESFDAMIVHEVKDDKNNLIPLNDDPSKVILKEGLTYDITMKMKTLFSSLLSDDSTSFTLEDDDLKTLESSIKGFFNYNQVINIREEANDELFHCVRFTLLYNADIFMDKDSVTKTFTFNTLSKDYIFYRYKAVTSVTIPDSDDLVL